MPSRRAPTRASLSSRTFWVVAVLFCIIESAMLLLAYQHTAAHRRLAEQLSFVRQGTVVAWHIAAGPSPEPRTEVPGIPAPRDARHRWLESVLQALVDGGPVHTLDNTEVALTPLEDSGARRSLTEALARWTSFSRLETLDPGSPASVSEISTLAPALAELPPLPADHAAVRDEAQRREEGPGHAVHRRRHGHRDVRRGRLSG